MSRRRSFLLITLILLIPMMVILAAQLMLRVGDVVNYVLMLLNRVPLNDSTPEIISAYNKNFEMLIQSNIPLLVSDGIALVSFPWILLVSPLLWVISMILWIASLEKKSLFKGAAVITGLNLLLLVGSAILLETFLVFAKAVGTIVYNLLFARQDYFTFDFINLFSFNVIALILICMFSIFPIVTYFVSLLKTKAEIEEEKKEEGVVE